MQKNSPIRKLYFVLVMGLFLTLSLGSVTFAATHTFKNETLEKLIELRTEGEYDVDEAQKMIDRIGEIPERLLSETLHAGVKLIFMNFPLTDLEEWAYLKGVVPRGWESTGLTWDDVPGVGGNPTAARIGYSDFGNGHSTVNLELHEFSHAIDYFALGFTISELDEFIEIHAEEKEPLFHDHRVGYYFEYIEEYFAETMAYYHLGGESKAILLERAPKTYYFIENLHLRVLSSDDKTSSTVSLTWDPVEGAAEYEIYRDNELIGSITEPIFTDTALEPNTAYSYYVRALSDSADVLITTFNRSIKTNNLVIPDAPTGLILSEKSSSSITISWNSVEDANRYEVLRNGVVIHTTTDTYYTDTNLNPNTTYEYIVRAINNEGVSTDSEMIIIATDAISNVDDTPEGNTDVEVDDKEQTENNPPSKDSDEKDSIQNGRNPESKESTNDESVGVEGSHKDLSEKDSNKLPKTATNMFHWIAIGILFILSGSVTFFVSCRKLRVNSML